jgi:5-deoxy-glucuronate isomerase
MSDLLVHAGRAPGNGTVTLVTPESAGWRYVGFEVIELGQGRPQEAVQSVSRNTGASEVCIVVVQGTCTIRSEHGEWAGLGGRETPFEGRPDAVYLPRGTAWELEGAAEVAVCSAPAPNGGAEARVLPGDEIEVETRGFGAQERTVVPILMGDRPAESLLVCEVLTPPGHWSSYPPHKHDRDALPEESYLEETYYHRIDPPHGFALQRVYTGDGNLDETLAVRDRDVVLVPRGYHTVSAPPGYAVYYLNVMAGPQRTWAIANDPDHEWMLNP